MERKDFHHALTILSDVCIGCSHCMRVCPTEALRVKNGKAILYENKCIDCGECFKVCPVRAIIIEQDDLKQIFDYKHRVALIPSVFFGQFSDKVTPAAVHNSLIEIGFTDVFEVENSAEMLSHAINRYIASPTAVKPVISSFCPAVVRLIQVKFPALVDNIMLLKPPLDISAVYYRKRLVDAGAKPEEIGIFYITPCAAKIAAIKSPVGEDSSEVTGVINMDTMYNQVLKNIRHKTSEALGLAQPFIKGKNIMWSLTNGESGHINGNCLAIDGIDSAIEFLEKLEGEEVTDIDFLEIRSCDEGCAGGVLSYGNRFLTVERMRKRSKQMGTTQTAPISGPGTDMWDSYPYLLQRIPLVEPIKPRNMVKLDEDMAKAMKKMERVQRYMCFLPGIDCGVCGAPTCRALAEDIVQGKAAISDCVFLQKNMEHSRKLHPDHSYRIMERIWGKDRLQKDCNKLKKKSLESRKSEG